MAELFPNAAAASSSIADSSDDGKMVDLYPKIETSSCYARNESKSFPMTNLFIGDSRLGCRSDTDEQIILHVEFSEFVKVRSLVARGDPPVFVRGYSSAVPVWISRQQKHKS